jgi:hypothetical protein
MTNIKVQKEEPMSGDRHPQSENYIKITVIICITVFLCFVLGGVFYFILQGNKEVFEWFKNIQVFCTGFFSALVVFGLPQLWKMLKKE